jgi:sugar lactone lactonase YvrE
MFFLRAFVSLVLVVFPLHISAQSTLEWRTLGNLREARHQFHAFPVSNSQILVIGGFTNSSCVLCGTPTRNCEIVDVARRSVSTGAALNYAHADGAALMAADSGIVVISGVTSSSGELTPTVEIFDKTTNSWKVAGSLLFARRQHTAVFISADEILVVGGRQRNLSSLAAAEVFNIRTGESRRVSDFPYPINLGISTISSKGDVLVGYGRSGGEGSFRSSTIYRFDTGTSSWAAYTDLPIALVIPAIINIPDGRVLCLNGSQSEGIAPNKVSDKAFIEEEDGFREISTLSTGRAWNKAVQWSSDSVLILGGYDTNLQALNTTEWLDTRTGSASPAPSMRSKRMFTQAVHLPGSIVVLSGMSGSRADVASIEILERVTDSVTVPVIVSFTPTHGTSGTSVVITGIGFTGTNAVSFGGVLAASFRVDAPTQITAVLSVAGASGAVRVETSAGSAEKSGFVYAAPMQVTTVASGLGRGIYHIVQDEQKNFYFPAQDQGKIYKVTPSGVVSVFFSVPPRYCTFTGGIARDKQGYFYAPFTCDKGIILRISPDGKQSSVFYQNNELGGIYGLEFDAEGNLWGICSKGTIGLLVKISPAGETTIVYQGTLIGQALCLKLDGRGNVFVTSYDQLNIIKINACGTATNVYNGKLPGYPNGITIGESGNLYVAINDPVDGSLGHILMKITLSGEATIFAGSGKQGHKDGSMRQAEFNGIAGLLFDETGNMYATDYFSGHLRKISNVGELPLNTNVKLYAGPQCNAFSPVKGTSGTVVTLRGTGLGCVKEITFGGVPAASFSIVSDNEIRAIVGAGATGAIRLTSPAGSASQETFTFLSIPVITSISASQLISGTTVIITGRNFLGATSVRFGGIEATIFSVDSDTRITAIVPVGAVSSSITIETPSGIAQYDGLQPTQPPVITALSANSASMGDSILISGRNFTGATQVAFGSTTNSVSAISFRVISDSVIVAVVGSGASGSVTVTTLQGIAVRNGFRFTTPVTRLGQLGYGMYQPVIDSRGNIFVTQELRGVWKFAPDGTITMFYRSPMPLGGLVIDKNDNLYMTADTGTQIMKILPTGEATVFCKHPLLRIVSGICMDKNGYLYGAAYQTNSIIKISPDGNTVTTVYAGSPLSDPVNVQMDINGNFVVSNYGNHAIVKITPCGTASILYQGALIRSPYGMTFSKSGNLYVGGYESGKVMKFSPQGVAEEYAGTGAAVPRNIWLATPTGVAIDRDGSMIVVDYRNGRVLRLSDTGEKPLDRDSIVSIMPTITSFTPTTGTAQQVLSIHGTHFACGVSRLTVGGVAAQEFTVVSDSLIIATLSTGATGAVSITTPLGTASREQFVFLSPAATTPTVVVTTPTITLPTVTLPTVTLVPPTIFSFTPAQGTSGTGRGFRGVTNVQFGTVTNATPAASFIVRSDSLIVATLAQGATGNVTVISTTGIATRSGFVFLVPTPVVPVVTTPTVIMPSRMDTTQIPLSLILPTITSLTPSCIAGSNMVTITGTGFIGRPEVRFGRLGSGTNLSRLILTQAVNVVSTTQIIAFVPNGLATFTGLPSGSKEFGISISTTTGTATRSGLQYVETRPVINAFSPSSATRGDKLHIVGQGFTCVSEVRVGGSTVASYVVVSDTLVIATLGQTDNGTVRLVTPAGVAERSGFVYALFPMSLLPNITSFSPTAARMGQTITITGMNFSGTNANGSPFTTTSLSLGGVSVPFTVVSPTQITLRLPDDFFTSGTDVRLSTPGGTVAAQGFRFVPEPVITAFTPDRASTGTVVMISGRNFTGATALAFGEVAAQSFTVLADTLLQAVVGDGASGAVRVTTPNGTATKAGFTFVIPPPFIASFTPTLFAPSTTITITGRNFVGNGYTTQLVLIGNLAGTIVSVSPTTLVVRAPAMLNSTTITVVTPGGTANGCCLTPPRAMLPMLAQPPRILGFSPASSGIGGTVTIRGENFTSASDIRFGDVTAASFRVVSPTEIQAVLGAGATGDVSVRTPVGAVSFAGFTFIAPPSPIITGFSPATGAAGDTVRVRGQYLQTVSAFSIAGDPNISVDATFTTSGDTLVTAVLGAGQSFSLGTITLRTLGGTARATGFTFIAAPVITSFSPTIAGNGDAVVINGAGFDGVQVIAFGNPPNLVQATSYVVNSPSRITARLSTGATGSVVVTTRGGSASRPGFVFASVPVITRFTPDSARAGETVRIVGSGFLSQSAVSTVSFGGVRAASFVVVSDSVITASPAQTGASGSISITTPGGTAQRIGFTFLAPQPTITSFSPQQASVGDIVTIVGTNLSGATSVSFGVRSAVTFLVPSSTQIVARVGNGTSGTITVQTPGGRAVSTPTFVFVPAPPVITSFSPDSAGAGQTVTLRGRDFSGIASVQFRAGSAAVSAQSFSITNDSTMSVRVPTLGLSRTVATVSVQSPNGTGSRTGLTFIPAPTISTFTPARATAGTTVVITGTNLGAATTVRFGGTTARSVVVDSDTQVTAIIGGGASGAVSVVTAGGTASRDGFTFLTEQVVITPPVVTRFNPQAAPANATVTISGTGFTGSGLSSVTGVQFGGVQAQSYAVLSPTTITAVVGTGASGAITLTSARGNSTLAGFRFIPTPVIADFTPKSAGRAGVVSIMGRNFAGATSVSFGGTAVQFTVSGDTLIRATLQIGSTGTVSVTTPGGTATMAGFTFTPSTFAVDDKGARTITGVQELASGVLQSTLRLYPNPVNDLLTIEATLPCAVQTVRLTLRNALGAVVMTLETQSVGGVLLKEVSVAKLASGAYSVELSCGAGERLVGRFVRF